MNSIIIGSQAFNTMPAAAGKPLSEEHASEKPRDTFSLSPREEAPVAKPSLFKRFAESKAGKYLESMASPCAFFAAPALTGLAVAALLPGASGIALGVGAGALVSSIQGITSDLEEKSAAFRGGLLWGAGYGLMGAAAQAAGGLGVALPVVSAVTIGTGFIAKAIVEPMLKWPEKWHQK
ncbi:MAG: hypothetical protein RDV48_25260 [Candidatus Eremiobacteraeota bacterium]|nr:hypothetical protein [Candidatus Eremiobacteraeota bacterium]